MSAKRFVTILSCCTVLGVLVGAWTYPIWHGWEGLAIGGSLGFAFGVLSTRTNISARTVFVTLLFTAIGARVGILMFPRNPWDGWEGLALGSYLGFALGLPVAIIESRRGEKQEAILRALEAREAQALEARRAAAREKYRAAQLEQQLEQQREAERQKRIQREEARTALEDKIATNARRAVEELDRLPGLIDNVKRESDSAARYFADGAFSPFWTAIERAYVELGRLWSAVTSIENCAAQHAAMLRDLTSLGDDNGFSQFPIAEIPDQLRTNCRVATSRLENQVYEAQKHPIFAVIWEQRRTTTAVKLGALSLEQAVESMTSRLSSSIDSLSVAIAASSRARDAHTSALIGLVEQSQRIGKTLSHQTI